MLVAEAIPANLTASRTLQQHLFSLLQNCNTTRKLTQIHTQIVTNGLTKKSFILAKLLSLYISSNSLQHAQQVFYHVENPSTTLWNQMIRGHSLTDKPYKSIEIYNEMVETNAVPDGYTYSFVVNACVRGSFLREGEQVHGRVLSNGCCSNVFVKTNLVNLYALFGGEEGVGRARRVFDEMTERNVVTWNSLLSGCFRCGDVDGARRIFDEMPERNVISWTTMISGCAKNGCCKQALSLFREMQRVRVELDQVTLVSALSACAELGDLKVGRWIHSYIDDTFPGSGKPILVSLNNALLHMYASCGEIEKAYEVFKRMPRRSTISWTTIITGFAKQGRAEDALTVFRWMQSLGENEARPDHITFIGVLSACSHASFVDEGRFFFKSMKQTWGIDPMIEHYVLMVDLLIRAGFFNEAYGLVEAMPMKPNEAMWGALLGGCRIHKIVELASHEARKLAMELDPDQAADYFVLLSNVYATANMWHDVASARKNMVEIDPLKPPSRSWVQIDGIIHDFLDGNITHKHVSLIHEMLGMVTTHSKWEAYKLDISKVLFNIEE